MPSPTTTYLITYNTLCTLGWAYVLTLALPTLYHSTLDGLNNGLDFLSAFKGACEGVYFATPSTAGFVDSSNNGEEGWYTLASILILVQSAALLEILHAGLGLVRSPVFVTMLQVGSRIVALHMVVYSEVAKGEFFFFLLSIIFYVFICC